MSCPVAEDFWEDEVAALDRTNRDIYISERYSYWNIPWWPERAMVYCNGGALHYICIPASFAYLYKIS